MTPWDFIELIMDRLTALEEAIRMMGLDPSKVARFVSSPHDACCKSILFAAMGIDETRLKARARNAPPDKWREMLDTLR